MKTSSSNYKLQKLWKTKLIVIIKMWKKMPLKMRYKKCLDYSKMRKEQKSCVAWCNQFCMTTTTSDAEPAAAIEGPAAASAQLQIRQLKQGLDGLRKLMKGLQRRMNEVEQTRLEELQQRLQQVQQDL